MKAYLQNLMQAVKNKGLTKKEFIELVGWSEPGFYSALKNDSFKYSDILRFCQVLGVQLHEISKYEPPVFTESKSRPPIVLDGLPAYGRNESEILFRLVNVVENLSKEVEGLKKVLENQH